MAVSYGDRQGASGCEERPRLGRGRETRGQDTFNFTKVEGPAKDTCSRKNDNREDCRVHGIPFERLREQ